VAANLQRFTSMKCCQAAASNRAFWVGFDALVHDLAPQEPCAAGRTCDALQVKLVWHREHPGQ
jgi:malate synthase